MASDVVRKTGASPSNVRFGVFGDAEGAEQQTAGTLCTSQQRKAPMQEIVGGACALGVVAWV